MNKILYCSLLILTSFFAHSQEIKQSEKIYTSIGLRYAANISFSSERNSFSVGGNWGLVLDHDFVEGRFGMTAGIGYTILHFAFNERFERPSSAIEFKLIESTFGIYYRPFESVDQFRIKTGYIHGLVIDSDWSVNSYNVSQAFFGVEYVFKGQSNLSPSVGMESRYYKMEEESFGANITTLLYFKIGMKS